MGVRGFYKCTGNESKPGGLARVQHHHEKRPQGRDNEIQLRAPSIPAHRGPQVQTPVCRKTARNFGKMKFQCFIFTS